MFAITADQVGSRHADDLVDGELVELSRLGGSRLLLPPDRTAGDELQLVTADATTALEAVLHLTRGAQWSVGLAVGEVRHPLPTTTRALAGSALELARTAVDAAKKRPLRFALEIEAGRHPDAATLQPLMELLLALRARRTPEGWQLAALLDGGDTQTQAAEKLGITPQAVSLRAQSAQLRLDAAARTALVTLLAETGSPPA
ncbi:DNA-binding protein [Lysinimonas soli]|uniref:DNA-binding protein n=1 Tax=Lysinimonas soli TaxID=1074233 RepID=A0ABW0NNQ3_9MICO